MSHAFLLSTSSFYSIDRDDVLGITTFAGIIDGYLSLFLLLFAFLREKWVKIDPFVFVRELFFCMISFVRSLRNDGCSITVCIGVIRR